MNHQIVKAKTTYSLIELLQDFISKHKSGRMLLKNGTRMRKGSISNYENLCKVLKNFCSSTNFELRICSLSKASFRELRKKISGQEIRDCKIIKGSLSRQMLHFLQQNIFSLHQKMSTRL